MNNIKRHFYNNQHYFLDTQTQKLILSSEFLDKLKNNNLWGKFGFKKIGGSSIGNVLKLNNFASEFAAFTNMSWIGLPILDRKYVDAGIAIEPKVIDVIRQISKKNVETFDPVQYNYNYFADKDDIVGGVPDGFIKETQTIIEIKTTGEKNLSNWKNYGVPKIYLRQAQLYAYLMDVSKYSIVATFLKEEDYLDPNNYPIEKRITKNWNYNVNLPQVQDDISQVKEWYKKYTNEGISPSYDKVKDKDLLEWLKCSNSLEWENLKSKWIVEGKLVI